MAADHALSLTCTESRDSSADPLDKHLYPANGENLLNDRPVFNAGEACPVSVASVLGVIFSAPPHSRQVSILCLLCSASFCTTASPVAADSAGVSLEFSGWSCIPYLRRYPSIIRSKVQCILGALCWKLLMRILYLVLAGLLVFGLAAAAAVWRLLTRRVQGAYFDSQGVRIHYTVEGSGPPVLLLHGFAVNGDINWRLPGIVRLLAEDFRVITLDLRGHGLSGKPHQARAYGMEMANDVLRLMDRLHIDRSHLVGYSLGGFIVLKLAAVAPQRLISASVLGAGWVPPDGVFMRALPKLQATLESGQGIGPLANHIGALKTKPGRLHTWSVKLMTGYFSDQQALAAMVQGLPGLAVSQQQLRHIAIPVCAIVGSQDPFRSGAEAMVGVLPDLQLTVVAGADHLRTPLLSKTRETLRAFLLELRAASGQS